MQFPFSNHRITVAGAKLSEAGARSHQSLMCDPFVYLARQRIIGNDHTICSRCPDRHNHRRQNRKGKPSLAHGAHQPANHVSQYGIVG
jgi:hypothetical protein